MVEVIPLMQGLYFGKGDVRADIETKFGPQGDLLDIYTTTTGSHVHKWHHYLPLYERYFGPWRKPGLRFLEIGVSRGGSLAMWRRYFAFFLGDLGIDQCLKPATRIVDQEPQAAPHLRRGKPDPVRGVHNIGHLRNQRPNSTVHKLNLLRRLEQYFPAVGLFILHDAAVVEGDIFVLFR